MQQYILGIETSCDETSASVVAEGRYILSNIINSQIDVHRRYGGIVPEIASRRHIENIGPVVQMALQDADIKPQDLAAIAVTNRPGLIGALLVGLSYAKAYAYGLGKPLITVNHLHGHICANQLEHEISYPLVCLVVSGGHTSIMYMRSPRDFNTLGETLDDAAGEAFDKVARYLGLGYPGGPAIQKAAVMGSPGVYTLPRVFADRKDYNFSFSGLKTAAMNLFHRAQQKGQEISVPDLAAEFQEALVEVLVLKTLRAAGEQQVSTIALAGGVAANARLRVMMEERAATMGIKVIYPSLQLCTDNGAMIAAAAWHHYQAKDFSPLDVNAFASSRTGVLG
ncbi:MAG: tRNA (adenosine(37)-N6)-threonylcarbamoyltransferase complex transferase subunit TsaD [Methanomassiliicoccales archaeon]